MLVVTRRPGERIIIGGEIEVVILPRQNFKAQQVKIGILAPDDVTVDRLEIHERRKANPNYQKQGRKK